MVDAQTISIFFAGLSIAASIVYYASILRNAEKSRKKDMIMNRLQMISEEDYRKWFEVITQQWSTYDEWFERYGPNTNLDAYITTQFMIHRYNNYGILLREGIIDSKILFEFNIPSSIIRLWEKVEPIILQRRLDLNHPEIYSAFEYLYNETKKQYPDLKLWSEVKS